MRRKISERYARRERGVPHVVLLSGLGRKRRDDRLFLQLVERRRKRDLVLDVDVGERAFAPRNVLYAQVFFYFFTSSVAASTHVFLPSPRMCGAAQVMGWANSSWIAASCFPPRRFGSSFQRMAW